MPMSYFEDHVEIITDGGRINPLPDADTVLAALHRWFEDYNENHPHSGLKWRSPRDFITAQL